MKAGGSPLYDRFMEGSFRLRQIIGGMPHWAEVAVRAEPAEYDEVTVSDGVLDWRREVYGPNASVGGPADQLLVAEAVAGAWYALGRRGDGATRYLVTITRIVDAPADTGVGDVKFAAVAATCQAVGVESERAPFIDATGVVFPDDPADRIRRPRPGRGDGRA
jgi:hypothetical protein